MAFIRKDLYFYTLFLFLSVGSCQVYITFKNHFLPPCIEFRLFLFHFVTLFFPPLNPPLCPSHKSSSLTFSLFPPLLQIDIIFTKFLPLCRYIGTLSITGVPTGYLYSKAWKSTLRIRLQVTSCLLLQ